MKCPKCGNSIPPGSERDGREVGGFPGVRYVCCPACGWSRAVVKKESKRERLDRLR